MDQGLGEDGGGGGAVTGHVVGLGRDLLGQLGTEVLVVVLELDLLGDGHAVVGDGGGAPLLVEDDVAALGPERDPTTLASLSTPASSERRASALNSSCFGMASRYLGYLLTIARTSRAERISSSSPPA